jgi:hypothetical protein
MIDAELLKFKITLSGTYWDRRPEFDILIDDQVVHSDAISCPSSGRGLHGSNTLLPVDPDHAQVIEFQHELNPGEHVLGIRFKNKTQDQTTGFVKQHVWLRDMLLTVENITIDDIDLQHLIYSQSEYVLDQPQIKDGKSVAALNNCVCLGWNGTYNIRILSPFYMWLLEKL